jgi:hypothetical protein
VRRFCSRADQIFVDQDHLPGAHPSS